MAAPWSLFACGACSDEAPTSLAGLVPGINPACTTQIACQDAVQLATVSSATGTASWSFAIPNDPVWADDYFSSQAAFFDSFSPGGVAVSRAGQVLTGARPRTSIDAESGESAGIATGSVSLDYDAVTFFELQWPAPPSRSAGSPDVAGEPVRTSMCSP